MKDMVKYFVNLLCTLALVALIAGCAADPSEGKEAATVNDAVEITTGSTDSDAPDANAAPAIPEGTKYFIDTEESVISFTGSKVTGPHSGGWSVYDGTVIVPEGDFTQAHITINIDMASTFSDDPDLTEKLIGEEFFEVATYPTSTFVSTSIEGEGEEFDVSGNLTLHGITKNLTFTVILDLSDEKLTAEAEFSFNRKDFNVDYDGKVDDLIRDNVLMLFYVEAKTE